MNWYCLFESQRTEPRVYRAWLRTVFPPLIEVKRLADLKQDNFIIRAGMGYPAYLDRVEEAVSDIESCGVVKHFFVCVDAEDDPVGMLAAIQRRVSGKNHFDVSTHCPESLPLWGKYGRTRAQFHKVYLNELLRENGHSYSEINPGVVRSAECLAALRNRHHNTGQIQSFGHLRGLWRSLGGQI